LPTFFPFDVRYFVGEGCAGQRNERR
jgi:hypothetical protein